MTMESLTLHLERGLTRRKKSTFTPIELCMTENGVEALEMGLATWSGVILRVTSEIGSLDMPMDKMDCLQIL
jgi:hypothetical protein